jgi:hypothetical protein
MSATQLAKPKHHIDRSIEIGFTYEEVRYLGTAMATMRHSPTFSVSFSTLEARAILLALQLRDDWRIEIELNPPEYMEPPFTEDELDEVETRLRESTWTSASFTGGELRWFHDVLRSSQAVIDDFFVANGYSQKRQLCDFLTALVGVDAGLDLQDILWRAERIYAENKPGRTPREAR